MLPTDRSPVFLSDVKTTAHHGVQLAVPLLNNVLLIGIFFI
ncbi:hypothetical protein ACIQ4Z_22895 [Peribacillus asahii]